MNPLLNGVSLHICNCEIRTVWIKWSLINKIILLLKKRTKYFVKRKKKHYLNYLYWYFIYLPIFKCLVNTVFANWTALCLYSSWMCSRPGVRCGPESRRGCCGDARGPRQPGAGDPSHDPASRQGGGDHPSQEEGQLHAAWEGKWLRSPQSACKPATCRRPNSASPPSCRLWRGSTRLWCRLSYVTSTLTVRPTTLSLAPLPSSSPSIRFLLPQLCWSSHIVAPCHEGQLHYQGINVFL